MKRGKILYKNFAANGKGIPMVCLRGVEIGSIDFFA